jgi:hypothetical protein
VTRPTKERLERILALKWTEDISAAYAVDDLFAEIDALTAERDDFAKRLCFALDEKVDLRDENAELTADRDEAREMVLRMYECCGCCEKEVQAKRKEWEVPDGK